MAKVHVYGLYRLHECENGEWVACYDGEPLHGAWETKAECFAGATEIVRKRKKSTR